MKKALLCLMSAVLAFSALVGCAKASGDVPANATAPTETTTQAKYQVTKKDAKAFEKMYNNVACFWEDFDTTEDSNLLDKLMPEVFADAYMYFFDVDFNTICEQKKPDPKKRLYYEYDEKFYNYFKFDADKIDWIIKDVFNSTVDRNRVTKLYYYQEDSFYLKASDGIGGERALCRVLDYVPLDDDCYGLTLGMYWYGNGDDWETRLFSGCSYAVAKYVNDDKVHDAYWSVVKYSTSGKCFKSAPTVYDAYAAYYKAYVDERDILSQELDLDSYDILDYEPCFAVVDINKDGMDDFVIHSGTCEADYVFKFYTYDNGLVELGEQPAGHAGLAFDANKNVFVIGGRGIDVDKMSLGIRRLSIDENELKSKVIFEGLLPESEYEDKTSGYDYIDFDQKFKTTKDFVATMKDDNN